MARCAVLPKCFGGRTGKRRRPSWTSTHTHARTQPAGPLHQLDELWQAAQQRQVGPVSVAPASVNATQDCLLLCALTSINTARCSADASRQQPHCCRHDTERFYKALTYCGLDFSIIALLFPGRDRCGCFEAVCLQVCARVCAGERWCMLSPTAASTSQSLRCCFLVATGAVYNGMHVGVLILIHAVCICRCRQFEAAAGNS